MAAGLAATLALATGGLAVTPAARAASTPILDKAAQTTLCATPGSSKYCSQTLTASIPAGTTVTVVCQHGPAYYIRVTAHVNQEGYVNKGDVSSPPSGLTDCDSPAHQAIWAAAWAIGYLGSTSPYGPGTCLEFVINAWQSTGVTIESDRSQTAASWWNSSYNKWTKETSGSSEYMTPPRGALVFWGPDRYSSAGHVAISVGNGWLVSTQEGDSTSAVHLLTIKERNDEPGVGAYLGWIKP
jgi:cell wall-associated NlpC family hydrolase